MKKEKKKAKRGRPFSKGEKKETTSIRMKPTVKLMLKKRYGGLQAAIDKLVIDDLNKMIRGEE